MQGQHKLYYYIYTIDVLGEPEEKAAAGGRIDVGPAYWRRSH